MSNMVDFGWKITNYNTEQSILVQYKNQNETVFHYFWYFIYPDKKKEA